MAVYQHSYGSKQLKWPYPILYEKETTVETDVLVIGGGLAGTCAAISARRKGLSVAIVDKAPIRKSGSGGTGIDHYNDVYTNPCSKLPLDTIMDDTGINAMDIKLHRYISGRLGWDVLLEIEKMGLPIRDVDDEFKGAPFRDEETKLLFAYDYKSKYNIKLRGGDKIKDVLYEETIKSGADIYERIMITSLLTEGGKSGARIVGATGISIQTGEFFIFKCKAAIVSCGCPKGIWIYNTELHGAAYEVADPNNTGDAHSMLWNAGASITLMYKAGIVWGGGPYGWPEYGVGNPDNTWFPCTMVDANGKEIPWEDANGEIVETVEERTLPRPGQDYSLGVFTSVTFKNGMTARQPRLIRNLSERIESGEFELPLYADLPSMPSMERRSIWGLMVGNEGKSRYAIYEHYNAAGFNPNQHLLRAPMFTLKGYDCPKDCLNWTSGEDGAVKYWKDAGMFGGAGGPIVDWDLMTDIEGVYVAGLAGTMAGGATSSCSTGWWAGAAVKSYVEKRKPKPEINEKQLKTEKERVYAPIHRRNEADNIGWKELWAGITRVMQGHCNDYFAEISLRLGLDWLKSLRENELTQTYARNPHELVRVLETESRLTVSEMFLQGCLSKVLSDAAGISDKFIVDKRQEDGTVKTTYMDMDYFLKPPYKPTLAENYEAANGGKE